MLKKAAIGKQDFSEIIESRKRTSGNGMMVSNLAKEALIDGGFIQEYVKNPEDLS